jgi:dihydroxy-acid dehydratase
VYVKLAGPADLVLASARSCPRSALQLQSRDLIADQVESAAGGHWLDGMVVIPGCDKNMPGTLMALGRLNRPGLMVYGGSIRAGRCGNGPKLDIVSAFQAYGKYLQDGETEAAEKERVRWRLCDSMPAGRSGYADASSIFPDQADTIRNSCPGPGACGGVSACILM